MLPAGPSSGGPAAAVPGGPLHSREALAERLLKRRTACAMTKHGRLQLWLQHQLLLNLQTLHSKEALRAAA